MVSKSKAKMSQADLEQQILIYLIENAPGATKTELRDNVLSNHNKLTKVLAAMLEAGLTEEMKVTKKAGHCDRDK